MSESLSIIAENLKREQKKLAFLAKRFPLYLDDLCGELLEKDAVSVGDEELALSYRHVKEALTDDMSKPNGTQDSTAFSAVTPIFSAELARLITKRVKVESYLPPYENTPSRVAYFRNAYSDLAFRRFSAELFEPTVSYHDSFGAVCEEVYNDRCDLAILPVESSHDGKLTAMEKLIAKYVLAPMLYPRVPVGDGFIKFGLFASTPTLYEGANAISFYLYDDGETALSSLLTAAFHLGCQLKECKVLTEEESHGSFRHAWYLTLQAESEEALLPLWLLLLCEYPHHLLSGFFKEIY